MTQEAHVTQGPLTTEAGAPVADNQNSETAGVGGPVLVQDQLLLEKLAHFNRERIPERVVHARGAGAYGTFTLTRDVSQWTRAKFLSEVGKQTETFLRFSTVAGNLGSADAVRDPRGFALKFYTEEGNYDLVGNNTPVFFIKDAIKFPDFIHTQKRDPYTGSQEADNVWDFWGLSPESTHQVTWLFGDRGIPASLPPHERLRLAHLPVEQRGRRGLLGQVPLQDRPGHQEPHQPRRPTGSPARTRTATSATCASRSSAATSRPGPCRSRSCRRPRRPTYRFNPFDLTKVWPHEDYPPIEIGKLELNRNPENIFAEVEQSIFSPAHFVPGIGPSPDKMLQGRLFAYGDAHRYRVGINADHLPVNRPHATEARTNCRDGYLYDGRHKGAKNYEPNSFGGPFQTDRPLWQPIAGHRRHRQPRGPRPRRGRRLRPGGQPLPADVGGREEPPDRQPGGLHRQGLARRHRRARDQQLPPGGRRLRQAAGGRGPGPARLTGTGRLSWRAGRIPCAGVRPARVLRGDAQAGTVRPGRAPSSG